MRDTQISNKRDVRQRSGKRIEKGTRLFLFISVAFVIAQAIWYMRIPVIFSFLSAAIVLFIVAQVVTSLSAADLLYFFFFLASTRIVTGLAGGKELQDLTLVVLFIAFVSFGNGRVSRRRLPRIFLLYALFILIVALRGAQLPFGSEITGFQRRWEFITALVSFLAGFYLSASVDFDRFTTVVFWFYLVVVAIGLMMVVFNIGQLPLFNTFSWELLKDYGGRFGILSVAGSMSFVILLCKPNLLRKLQLRRPIFFLSVLAILAGGGRAAIIAAILSVLSYFYFVRRKKTAVLITALGSVLLVSGFSLGPVRDVMPERVQRAFDFGKLDMIEYALSDLGGKDSKLDVFVSSPGDWSTAGRLLIWGKALMAIGNSPWLGQGLEKIYVGEKRTSVSTQQQMSNATLLATGDLHNTYLSLAYTFGILALAAFLIFTGKAVVYASRLKDYDEPAYAFFFVYLISMLIQGAVGDIYFDYQFMLILGMVYARYAQLGLHLPSRTLAPSEGV